MLASHQLFLDAIAQKRRVSIRFIHPKEKRELTCICAALDFGPLRGSQDTRDRYQLWNLEGKKRPLNIPLLAEEILEMQLLEDTFDPAEIITWAFKPGCWSVAREWGTFS